jgi:hypothetical protein
MGTRVGAPPVTSDIASNPYALSAINASISPVMRAFTEQIRPQIGSEAVRAGAWGGTDHLKAQMLAGERAQQQAYEAASRLALPLYAQERGIETDLTKQMNDLNMNMSAQEMAMAPGLTAQGLQQQQAGLGLQQQAAGQERNWAQEDVSEQQARYQMGVEAPWQAVNPYMRLVAGFDPGGTSTMTSVAPQATSSQSMLGGALAGGLGGWGLSTMLPAAMNPGLWPLVLGGGLLGGLAGGL